MPQDSIFYQAMVTLSVVKVGKIAFLAKFKLKSMAFFHRNHAN